MFPEFSRFDYHIPLQTRFAWFPVSNVAEEIELAARHPATTLRLSMAIEIRLRKHSCVRRVILMGHDCNQ